MRQFFRPRKLPGESGCHYWHGALLRPAPVHRRKFSALPEVDTVIYREPARYKLLVDFHRYFTFEIFRRINEESSRAISRMGTHGRVSCYPFTQHFIIWPGANQRHGNSFYWYHRFSPVVNVEHCWPEAPVTKGWFWLYDI